MTTTAQIVNLNTKVARAPTPSQLQQSGALISIGGTTLTPGAYQFCSTLSAVLSILDTSGNYVELTNMATEFFAQGSSIGVYVLELGVENTEVASVTVGAATYTYTSTPTVTFSAPTNSGGILATGVVVLSGTQVSGITITNAGYYPGQAAPTATLSAATTGTGPVLTPVLGSLDVDTQIQSLQTWITANPGVFYAYLTPVNWDTLSQEVGSVQIGAATYTYTSTPTVTFTAATDVGVTATGTAVLLGTQVIGITITNPGYYPSQPAPTATLSAATTGTAPALTVTMANALNVLAENYSSPSGKTYFFVTTELALLPGYATNKSVIATIPSPTAVSTEFQAATAFWNWLSNNPGSANPLAPMAYRYVYGVTPWVQAGNTNAINNILSDYGNIILTGAEGGISIACLFKGFTMDGAQSAWWYGVDWFQINVKQALAAAIINGSNSNPPLLYDQAGINTLLKVANTTGQNGVTFGCLLSCVVTATPFATYIAENPGAYTVGQYGGFLATIVGQNGFIVLQFYIDAVQF